MDKPSFDRWPVAQSPVKVSEDTVHVFRIDLGISTETCARLQSALSEDERERAARYRFEEPRLRFVACRTALRQILASITNQRPAEIQFQYGEHGKPRLTSTSSSEASIEFNVSHSRDLGLIAVAVGAPLGIDIEECNSNIKILKLAERFFAPAEADALKNLSPEKQLAGFFRGWTCKEAYIKATGKGLAQSLSSFCVSIDPDVAPALRSVEGQHDEPANWTVSALDVESGFAAAVMVRRPGCQVECWSWPIT
jgi:4'-phosphopantetheinyl transferase